MLAELGITWFEEPLPADDLAGHARLAAQSRVPIAVGESLYSPGQFADYLRAGACSIVQVDVARIGGITPWLKVAHMAEAMNIAVCPHFLMELHVSLVCAIPNAWMLEYIPQLDDDHPVAAGYPRAAWRTRPTAPGLGIDWDHQAISGTDSRRQPQRPQGVRMQRMGMVIGLKADKVEDYKRLHAAVWPEILAKITRLQHQQLLDLPARQPENLMFSYFEYHGTDFAADMAKMAADPRNAGMVGGLHAAARTRWTPARRANGGPTMDEVFHHD